jgi:nucleotidyltransferase/DNA polymerase involved in DNA repair
VTVMFATIYLPDFYLQAALRYQPELCMKPAALIEEEDRKPVVIQLNEAAKAAGIRRGMTPSQALARFLHVTIKVRAREQENLIEEILLQHAFTLSPFIEATAPGICTIQFSDNGRLHSTSADRSLPENLTPWLGRVIKQLMKCEINARAGIAPTPDGSFLAAHLARPVLQIDDTKTFLSPLPIETLTTFALR